MDNNSLSIDFKKLKEEYINKSNKRVKARSILLILKLIILIRGLIALILGLIALLINHH